jgi:hypothetical protein
VIRFGPGGLKERGPPGHGVPLVLPLGAPVLRTRVPGDVINDYERQGKDTG